MDREDKIRLRAYEIWEREGMVGDPLDHWLRAERELEDEETAGSAKQRSDGSGELSDGSEGQPS